MNQIKIKSYFFVLISILFLIGCNDATTDADKTEMDTSASVTNNDNSDIPAYDAAKEPLTVEAAFANKLADTLNVKMYEITLKPGDTVALHNHPDHSMYVIQGGKLLITVEGAEGKEFDLKAGMGMMTGAENHTGKNVGKTTVKLLLHDIYRPRGK